MSHRGCRRRRTPLHAKAANLSREVLNRTKSLCKLIPARKDASLTYTTGRVDKRRFLKRKNSINEIFNFYENARKVSLVGPFAMIIFLIKKTRSRMDARCDKLLRRN